MMRYAAMVFALAFTSTAQGDDLGRLFTTPEERMARDRPPAERAVPPRRMAVQAVVQRGGAAPVVIIDGEVARPGERTRSGIRVLAAGADGVVVQLEGHRRPVIAMPGAALLIAPDTGKGAP